MSEATYALMWDSFCSSTLRTEGTWLPVLAHLKYFYLLLHALYLVSQARLTSAKRKGSGELHVQTVSCYTLQCGTITIAAFCHMMHYMTV